MAANTRRFETKAYRAWVGFNVPAKIEQELDLHDGQVVELLVEGSVTGTHPKRQEKLTSGCEIRWHGEPFEPYEWLRVTIKPV
jgi:hypothetical protein